MAEKTEQANIQKTSVPEKTKTKPGKKYVPGSSLNYEFAPTGLISEDDTKKTDSSTDSRSPDMKTNMTYLVNSTRQKILDFKKDEEESESSKSSFSRSMQATMKNKRNS